MGLPACTTRVQSVHIRRDKVACLVFHHHTAHMLFKSSGYQTFFWHDAKKKFMHRHPTILYQLVTMIKEATDIKRIWAGFL